MFTNNYYPKNHFPLPVLRCWADDEDIVDPTEEEMYDAMYPDEDSRPSEEDLY